MADYLVLRRDVETWHEVAHIDATSADQAIRKSEKQGLVVAVPARSWQPRNVTAETKTVLKLEAAGTKDTEPASE